VRDKAKVEGAMASIVEWQAFRMQEYRYRLMIALGTMVELFGVGQLQRRVPAVALAEASRPMARMSGNGRSLWAGRRKPEVKPPATAGKPDEVAQAVSEVAVQLEFPLPPRILRHRVILPLSELHDGSFTALRYAQSLSHDVTAVHVAVDHAEAAKFQRDWDA
jgi:hypothetical protein